MPFPLLRAAIKVERLFHNVPAHEFDQTFAVFRWDTDENDRGIRSVAAADNGTKFSLEIAARVVDRD
jgi:hypothetical protein